MNRYYRPSAPRYTSQFVQEQYPTELLMQTGAMKYQNKQKIAGEMAELSALTNVLPAGNRTQEMANEVRAEWDNNINELINKYSNNYDSPQALMEFTKLKQRFQRDPDIQLMKQDYEIGNKQWEDIRKSPTFLLDKKGDNINPETEQLWQFSRGDQYRDYSPVTRYVDWEEEASKGLRSIPKQGRYVKERRPYTDELGNTGMEEVQGQISERDPNSIVEQTISMAENVLNRSTPAGAYLYEDLKERFGRPPTMEEVLKVYEPIAKGAVERSENIHTLWKEQNNAGGRSREGFNPDAVSNVTDPYPVGGRTGADISKNEIRLMKNTNKFLKTLPEGKEIDFKNNEKYNNILAKIQKEVDPEIRTKTFKEQANAINDYIDTLEGDDKKQQEYYIKRLDWEESEKLQDRYFSGNVKDGVIGKGGVPSSALLGTNVWNQETGEKITEKSELEKLLKEGNVLKIEGVPDNSVVAELDAPGMIHATIGDKRIMFQGPQEYADKYRPEWNWNSFMRHPVTGMGDGFVLILGGIDENGRHIKNQYKDITHYGMQEENIPAMGGSALHIIPYQNHEDGNVHIGVYAANPKSETNEMPKNTIADAVRSAAMKVPGVSDIPGIGDLLESKNRVQTLKNVQSSRIKGEENYGIIDQTNPMLIKDYIVPKDIPADQRIKYIQAQIYNEATELLEQKMKLRPDLYQ